MSALTYMPGTHCVVCVNTEKRQVSATRQVARGARTYRVCDAHVEVVERCASIDDALREVRRQRAIGGVV